MRHIRDGDRTFDWPGDARTSVAGDGVSGTVGRPKRRCEEEEVHEEDEVGVGEGAPHSTCGYLKVRRWKRNGRRGNRGDRPKIRNDGAWIFGITK